MKSPLVLDQPIEEVKVDIVQVEEKVNTVIPNNYIAIHLNSNGILSAPKILHFRDYTMEDALNLNTLDEDEQLNVIVNTLNNMVYEKDFDCKNLHPKELSEIVYSIHGVFINSKIEKEYYYDEDLPEGNKEGQLDHESNIGTIEIPIKSIKTKNINKNIDGSKKEIKFKEPFILVDDITKDKIAVRLTRVYDLIFAKTYCDTKFEEELKDFAPYKRKILKLRDIKNIKERNEALDKIIEEDYNYFDSYRKFLSTYETIYATIVQALVIVSLNGVECKNIDDKLVIYRTNFSKTMWEFYDEIIMEYDFGILDKVTFYCEKYHKDISRRFSFRFDDFLSTPNKNNSRRYSVQFD